MGMVKTKRRSMSPARRRRIFSAHDGVCGYCHELIEDGAAFEIDHAVPLALGGTDDDGPNAYPIHGDCHRLKTFGRKGGSRLPSDISAIAKAKRLRAKRLGLARPKRSCLTDPRWVRKVDGTVVPRAPASEHGEAA